MFFESHCTNLVRSSALVYLWTSVRSSEISISTQHYLGPFGKSMWSSGCWDRYRHKELWHIPDYTVLRQIPKKVQFEKDSKTRHFFFFFKKYKRFTALKELTFKSRVKKKCWFSVLRYYYKSNKHTQIISHFLKHYVLFGWDSHLHMIIFFVVYVTYFFFSPKLFFSLPLCVCTSQNKVCFWPLLSKSCILVT